MAERLVEFASSESNRLEVNPRSALAEMFSRLEQVIPDDERQTIGDTTITNKTHYADLDRMQRRKNSAGSS
jgi:hypothetical protein